VPDAPYDLTWYVERLLSGRPFSLVRYGEGEWHNVVPGLPLKREVCQSPADPVFVAHGEPDIIERTRAAVLATPRSPRFVVADTADADWRMRNRPEYTAARDNWLAEVGLGDLTWHDGTVWNRAVAMGEFHLVVNALRGCGLPLAFVGPRRIEGCILGRFRAATFVPVHHYLAFQDIDRAKEELVAISPACISVGAGSAAKVIITELFPVIGHESTMIDFGALWDGLCGNKVRMYQRRFWNRDVVRRAWNGPA
jgi:hypothetical protein